MSVINFGIPTDLQVAGNLTVNSLNGLLKGTAGLVSAATAGVDYATPAQLTSLSGFTTTMSGALQSLITGAAGDVNSINGATGDLTLTSAPANANYVKVSTSGTTIYVSGDTTPLLSGVTLAGGGTLSGNASVAYFTNRLAVNGASSASNRHLTVSDGTNPTIGLQVAGVPSWAFGADVQNNLLFAREGVGAVINANGSAVSNSLSISPNSNTLLGTTGDSLNGKLQLATHTTSGGGLGLGPTVSLWTPAPNNLQTNVSGFTVSGVATNSASHLRVLNGSPRGFSIGVTPGNNGVFQIFNGGSWITTSTTINDGTSTLILGPGGNQNNGIFQIPTHTTSGAGLGLGPDNSIWRTAANQVTYNGTMTLTGLVLPGGGRVSGDAGNVYLRTNIVLNDNLTIGSSSSSLIVHAPATFPINLTNGVNIAALPAGVGMGNAGTEGNGSLVLWSRSNAAAGIIFAGNNTSYGVIQPGGTLVMKSGLFFADTGNYTPSGAASVAQLYGASGGLIAAIGAGAAANVVYTTGVQTINGAKTFAGSNLVVTGGNVGIGTTTPSALLAISGGILRAEGPALLAVTGGSVGVGTTAPQTLLHVSGGNLRVDGSGTFAGPVLVGTTGVTGFGALQLAVGSTSGAGIGFGPNVMLYQTNQLNLTLETNAAQAPTFTLRGTDRNATITIDNSVAGINVVRLGVNRDVAAGSNQAFIFRDNAAINTIGAIGFDSAFGMAFQTRASGAGTITTALTIASGQNVGIGLTNPTSKLVVSGTSLFTDVVTCGSGIVLGQSNVTGGGVMFFDTALYRSSVGNLIQNSPTTSSSFNWAEAGAVKAYITTNAGVTTLATNQATSLVLGTNNATVLTLGTDLGTTAANYVSAKSYRVTTSGVAIPLIGPSATGTYNVDFTNSPGLQTITITGSTLFSGVNYAAGGAATLRVNVSGANSAAVRFPNAWNWVSSMPTGIATGRFAILTMNTFTANDSGVCSAWSVAP